MAGASAMKLEVEIFDPALGKENFEGDLGALYERYAIFRNNVIKELVSTANLPLELEADGQDIWYVVQVVSNRIHELLNKDIETWESFTHDTNRCLSAGPGCDHCPHCDHRKILEAYEGL